MITISAGVGGGRGAVGAESEDGPGVQGGRAEDTGVTHYKTEAAICQGRGNLSGRVFCLRNIG